MVRFRLYVAHLQNPPRQEKLAGILACTYSRDINTHERLVYEIFPKQHIVRVFRMWTQYE